MSSALYECGIIIAYTVGTDQQTYTITFPRFRGTSVIPGGVYCAPERVRENATDLVRIVSPTLANGQWYFDAAADTLYIRTTTGASPDVFIAYQVYVLVPVASTGVVLDTAVYYWPWLTSDVPATSEQAADPLFGGVITPSGEIVMANAHRFWHAVFARDGIWNWENKQATIFFGGRLAGTLLARSQFEPVTTVLIEGAMADEDVATLRTKPVTRLLEKPVPPTLFTAATYANLGTSVEGKPIPHGYGRAVLTAVLIDTTASQGKWKWGDDALMTTHTMNGVVAKKRNAEGHGTGERVALTVTTHYTINLTLNELTVTDATYTYKDYEIEVDVTGKPISAAVAAVTGLTAGNPCNTFAPIVADLLLSVLGIPASQLDTAAFREVAARETHELGVWLGVDGAQRSLESIFSSTRDREPSLSRSVLGAVQQTVDGKWYVRAFDLGFDTVNGVSLGREDLVSFVGDNAPKSSFWKTVVFYARNFSTDIWPYQEAPSTRTRYRNETEDIAQLWTYLRVGADALATASQYEAIAGANRAGYEYVERGAKLLRARSGDRVAITYDPAMAASGALVQKIFQIERIDKAYAPKGQTSGRLLDTSVFTQLDPTNIIPWLTYSGPVSDRINMALAKRLVLNVPGTYTLTVDAQMTVTVHGVAGGGGGGGGSWELGNPGQGASGGGGGARNTTGESVVLVQGSTYEFIVGGAGSRGTGVVGDAGFDGGDGGTTKFSVQGGTVYMQLGGGGHGRHPFTGSPPTGGAGGAATTGANSVAGGAGGDGGSGSGGGAGGGSGVPGGGGGGAGGAAYPTIGYTGGAGGNSGAAGMVGYVNDEHAESYGGRGGSGAGVQLTGDTTTRGAGGAGGGNVSGISVGPQENSSDGTAGQQGVGILTFVSAP